MFTEYDHLFGGQGVYQSQKTYFNRWPYKKGHNILNTLDNFLPKPLYNCALPEYMYEIHSNRTAPPAAG